MAKVHRINSKRKPKNKPAGDGELPVAWQTKSGFASTETVLQDKQRRQKPDVMAEAMVGSGGDEQYRDVDNEFKFTYPTFKKKPNEDFLSGSWTDVGNSERLVSYFDGNARFVSDKGSTKGNWLFFEFAYWKEGNLRAIKFAKGMVDLMEGLAFKKAKTLDDEKKEKALTRFVTTSKSNASINNMISLAKPELNIEHDILDRNPYLLTTRGNTIDGATIDLRTGNSYPPRREDMITKCIPLEYKPKARNQLWEDFMDHVTQGDRLFRRWLMKAVGYSLSGLTGEEKLFFVYGPTATGKSTFIESLLCMFGEYGMNAPFSTFLQKKFTGGISNDRAMLRGKRFVAAGEEVDERAYLDHGFLKKLISGDTVTVRFLHKEFFQFIPQCKVWLMSNHSPKVDVDDDAMWRRIYRIPFDNQIAEEKMDDSIKQELKYVPECQAAIFAEAVDGFLNWRKEGLKKDVPMQVVDSTENYRKEVDPIAEFLDVCCKLSSSENDDLANTWTSTVNLYTVYKFWCKENGEEPVSLRWFGRSLVNKGLTPQRKKLGKGFRGIVLTVEA